MPAAQGSVRTAAAVVPVLIALAVPAARGPAPVPLDVPGRADSHPWAAASGTFVAAAWGAAAAGGYDVFAAVSRDAGVTFGTPVRVNAVPGEARLGGELPPRVAVHTGRGRSTPDVVVLWTARADATAIKTSRSRDGGGTFEPPVTLQAAGAPGDRGWPAVALDEQGAAHAIWLDHRGLAARHASRGSHAAQAADGRTDGVGMAAHSALYYARVAAAPAERALTAGVCYCCKTALASGPGGVLYAAWRHVYPGNLRDIAFSMSRDGGRSFSAPARVSADGWALDGCPDDGPAVAVDAGGVAHVVWPTVLTGDEPEGALFYASTRDGRQFTPRRRIPTFGGPKPSHPQIAIGRSGRMFVAWDETVGGRRVAAVREIETAPGSAPAFGRILTLAEDGPAMYPALAVTDRGVVAVWTTGGAPSRVFGRLLQLP